MLAGRPAEVLFNFALFSRLSLPHLGCILFLITKIGSNVKNLHSENESARELSAVDRRILRLLQRNGRMSNTELAKEVGLSPAACWNHTKRLFDDGVIKGVHALVDPQAVQRGTLVLVGVVLDRSTPEAFAAFEETARSMNQVLECVLVAGEVDYFMKIRVKDLPAFNRLHTERLIAMPGVRQVRTFFVMNEVKMDGLLPL